MQCVWRKESCMPSPSEERDKRRVCVDCVVREIGKGCNLSLGWWEIQQCWVCMKLSLSIVDVCNLPNYLNRCIFSIFSALHISAACCISGLWVWRFFPNNMSISLALFQIRCQTQIIRQNLLCNWFGGQIDPHPLSLCLSNQALISLITLFRLLCSLNTCLHT